jgi:hypothetical protein
MNRYLTLLAVLTLALAASAFACSQDGQHEPPKLFDPKTEGDLVDPKTLTPIEKRLNLIIVPEIDFRCANIRDIIDFYDHCVKEHGGEQEKHDKSRVRLVADKKGFGKHEPLLHFGSLKMPLLYALRLSCDVGMLKYRIKDNVVTVYKPEQMDGPTTKSTVLPEAAQSADSDKR